MRNLKYFAADSVSTTSSPTRIGEWLEWFELSSEDNDLSLIQCQQKVVGRYPVFVVLCGEFQMTQFKFW